MTGSMTSTQRRVVATDLLAYQPTNNERADWADVLRKTDLRCHHCGAGHRTAEPIPSARPVARADPAVRRGGPALEAKAAKKAATPSYRAALCVECVSQ